MNEETKHIESCRAEDVGSEIIKAATGDKFDALVTEALTGEKPAQPYTSWIVEFKSLLILFLRKLYYSPLILFGNTSIKDFIAGLQATIATKTAEITAMLSDIALSYQAISEKGGTLPQEQTSANLPAAIESIPTGDYYDLALGIQLYTNRFPPYIMTISQLTSCKFDASKASVFTNLSYFFNGASNLTKLRIPSVLPNVTTCLGMLVHCSKLTGSWEFTLNSCTSCETMFRYCSKVESVKLTVPNNTSFNQMCQSCTSLTSLEVSASKSTSIRNIASECTALITVKIGTPSTTSNVNCEYPFTNCSQIVTCEMGDFSRGTNMGGMFYNCTSLQNLTFEALPDADLSYRFLQNSPLTHDSLLSVLNALPNTSNGYTINLGANNLAKLSNDEKAIATSKGWQLS